MKINILSTLLFLSVGLLYSQSIFGMEYKSDVAKESLESDYKKLVSRYENLKDILNKDAPTPYGYPTRFDNYIKDNIKPDLEELISSIKNSIENAQKLNNKPLIKKLNALLNSVRSDFWFAID